MKRISSFIVLFALALLFLSFSKLTYAQTLLQDPFNASENTSLYDYNNTDYFYNTYGTNFISNDRLYSGGTVISISKFSTDFCISMDYSASIDQFFELEGRKILESGVYMKVTPDLSTIVLGDSDGIINTINYNYSGTHNVKFCAVGPQLIGLIDNAQVLSGTSDISHFGSFVVYYYNIDTNQVNYSSFIDNLLITNASELGLPPSPQGDTSTLIQESFTDTDGTQLSSHDKYLEYDPYGNNYILNNQLHSGGTVLDFNVGYGLVSTDSCLSIDYSAIPNQYLGLQSRKTYGNLPEEHVYFKISPSLTSVSLEDTKGMIKTVNYNYSGTHNVKFCAIGNQLQGFIDNTQVISGTTNVTTAGEFQIDFYNILDNSNQTAYLDNLLLTNGSEYTNPTPVNVPPVVTQISTSSNPIQVNSAVTTTANFEDGNVGDTHTAVWDWGDGSLSVCPINSIDCTLAENSGSGSTTAVHTYTQAGVYQIALTVTDSNNGSVSTTYQYLSVYNPTPQGLFSGARIFTSPAGSYPSLPNLTGQVQFGITAKYKNDVPTGSILMKFNNANITFESTALTVLVTSNSKAVLRGIGTINGTGNYSFLATGIDGANDTIRFQIKDGSNIIYDSQLGAPDTADPTASVIGQVIVH